MSSTRKIVCMGDQRYQIDDPALQDNEYIVIDPVYGNAMVWIVRYVQIHDHGQRTIKMAWPHVHPNERKFTSISEATLAAGVWAGQLDQLRVLAAAGQKRAPLDIDQDGGVSSVLRPLEELWADIEE
jgi:hypothetical protein